MPKIDELRSAIAESDREILKLIGERLKLAEKIGEIKKEQGLDIIVSEVEEAVLARYVEVGKSCGIREETAKKLARLLIDEAVAHQKNIRE
ncbi:MAG TPA: chorismate mutase [Methanocorpusculum sp.]|nr:chorismate mutase [Methanocorpusculum sp.]